jgi:hypothetical protein
MVAFVTLCEAYMGIEPHFDLWNYFPCARLQQDLDVEMAALGRVDILVRSESRVDPYFHLPLFDPPVGWWKIWVFLRNDADTPLPTFTGSHPIPQPNWGYCVAQTDLHRLQTL